MIKKMMLLAVAAAAFLAVAVPTASAWWYDEGIPIDANVTEHFVGPAKFESGGGGTECEVTANAILTATEPDGENPPKRSTIGHIEQFLAVDPTACDVFGGLAFLAGGTRSLTATHFTSGTIDSRSASDDISVYDLVFHNTYKSGLEVTLKTTGTETVTLTPDNPSAIKHLTISGDLDSSLGGTVTVSGNLTPTKPGTYGVTP